MSCVPRERAAGSSARGIKHVARKISHSVMSVPWHDAAVLSIIRTNELIKGSF